MGEICGGRQGTGSSSLQVWGAWLNIRTHGADIGNRHCRVSRMLSYPKVG
jgi:hypothetical protein